MQSDSLVGQVLDGRYQVESRIGEGGMGAVYKARHLHMAQPVAVKVLRTDRTSDEVMIKRFVREARSSFQINHANCVRVTDFSALPDGTLYMVMEFLDGRTVDAELFADGPMSAPRVRHIAAQICEALAHAHSLGLVHRDLKPGNIMLLQQGNDNDFVKVFDFGLAKLFDGGAVLTGLSLSPLTQSGIVFGTPEYMSPEQALGGDLSPKSDVYTVGVCCYEMLTGCVPFAGAAFTEILRQHVVEKPQRPSGKRPDLAIEPALEDIVMRCLHKDAAMRPDTGELVALLRAAGSKSITTSGPATLLTSSETLILPSPDSAPQTMAGSAFFAEDALARAANARDRAARRPKRLGFILGFGLLAGAGLGSLALRDGDTQASEQVGKAASLNATEDAAILAKAPIDAGDRKPAEQLASRDASDAEAAEPEARRVRPDKQVESNAHLQAAEAAYGAGNLLKQLAEANAALREMPKSRRAAYLVGDALDKSGDKVRACAFFKRASRKHYRAKGCGD